MASLDLDINNYSIKDIEHFFRLDSKKKYTASEIELREVTIREQLIKSGHVDKRFVKDLIDFTQLAKDWLIFVKCPEPPPPTTLPKNVRLDSYDYPRSAIPPQTREGEILTREKTQFVYTQPSSFFPGDLNPLNTRTITKCLSVDTKFRENYYNTDSSDFTVQLPTKLVKVVSMELTAMELPTSFYYISKERGNHFLWMQVDVSGQRSQKTFFAIPDGNYSTKELVDKLNSVIQNTTCTRDSSGHVFNEPTVFSGIEFVINTSTSNYENGIGMVQLHKFGTMEQKIQKIVLDFSLNLDGQSDYTTLSTRLGWILGFQKVNYSGTTIVADSVADDAYFKYIYLGVDDFQNNANNNYISSFQNSIFQSNILARLSLNTKETQRTFFSNIFNTISEPRTYFGPVDIQRLQFRLFDEYGKIIPMNHINYSLCLKFQLLYNL